MVGLLMTDTGMLHVGVWVAGPWDCALERRVTEDAFLYADEEEVLLNFRHTMNIWTLLTRASMECKNQWSTVTFYTNHQDRAWILTSVMTSLTWNDLSYFIVCKCRTARLLSVCFSCESVRFRTLGFRLNRLNVTTDYFHNSYTLTSAFERGHLNFP